MTESVADLLENAPRFVVAIAPQRYDTHRLSIERCQQIIETAQVRARGWYFPHVDRDRLSVGPREQYLANETNHPGFSHHLEQWRLYRSGQFLFRMKLWEAADDGMQDAMRNELASWNRSRIDVASIPGFVAFVMLIYSVSEAYVFAARLAQAAPYDTAVDINVRLAGVRGWALGSRDPAVHLDSTYVCRIPVAEFRTSVAIDELIADPLSNAVNAVQSLFRQFSWLDSSPAMVSNWQREIFKAAQ